MLIKGLTSAGSALSPAEANKLHPKAPEVKALYTTAASRSKMVLKCSYVQKIPDAGQGLLYVEACQGACSGQCDKLHTQDLTTGNHPMSVGTQDTSMGHDLNGYLMAQQAGLMVPSSARESVEKNSFGNHACISSNPRDC